MSEDQVDVVRLVRDGKARYEWHWITSSIDRLRLRIAVLRDAMKFDGLPQLDWYRRTVSSGLDRTYDGVRLPASADELQQIADIVGGMMLTPRVCDLIWLQAGIRFDANINSGPPDYEIVATMDVTRVHDLIESDVRSAGGDSGTRLISCVGKYWVLINELESAGKTQGDWTACNYGWFSDGAPGPGLTHGTRCWQRPGYGHNKLHLDPSQTIRLMWKMGELSRDEGETWTAADLQEVAADPDLASLLTHDGRPLLYRRQKGVESQPRGGYIVLPPVTISGSAEIGETVDPKKQVRVS